MKTPIYKTFQGTNLQYRALHFWVQRKLGKPKICIVCNKKDAKRYEWANISGKYLRDTSDWQRMCTRCHRLHDNGNKQNHCINGHELLDDNVYVDPRGTRNCRICTNASARRYKAKIRASK